MEDEKELEWQPIESRRNVMLSKSDWSQLIDAGLSRRCVVEWRKWRGDLRSVSSEQYPNRLDAIVELRRLRDHQPTVEYAPEDEVAWEQQGDIISKIDLKNAIKEVMLESTPPVEAPESLTEREMLNQATDMVIARGIARKVVNTRYHASMKHCSPSPELQTVYNERLSQAIDLLSEVSEIVPLLDVMANALNESVVTVATSVIDKHRDTISKMCTVESDYLHMLKLIQKADTIDDLKEILEYGR